MKGVARLSLIAFLASTLSWPSSQKTLISRASPPLPSPISVTASQYWDGDDGQWSTFEFEVGLPPQQIRLLPGTSTSTLYFISPQGCSADAVPPNPSDCTQSRGGTFNPNGSSTWAGAGVYQYEANLSQSSLLGYDAKSEMGYDTVVLGWPGAVDPPTIQNQLIGGLLEAQIWWIGNFGLSPRPTNLSSQNDEFPTPLTSLRTQNLIPSTTWAYTAGFHGAQLPTFGSLTLGGYDTTRFLPNNPPFTIPFGNDQTRDLVVAVQSISSTTDFADASDHLLPDPIYAFIDSTIPTIWLPFEACQAFEKSFNLVWEADTGYYIVGNDLHESLLASNPSITFELGPSLAGGSTVSITLPYAAFDLQLTAPIATNTSFNYFPLQRAANSSQYVLGRTFLQQAYIIADYDRNEFTVAQALLPQQNVQPNIVPILTPSESTAQATTTGTSHSKKLSAASIGGVVAAVVVAAVGAIVAFVVIFIRRRRSREMHAPSSPTDTASMSAERPPLPHQPTSQPPEYGTQSQFEKPELHSDCSPPPQREDVVWGKMELSGDSRIISELEEQTTRAKMHEIDSSPTINELDGTADDGIDQGRKERTSRSRVFELE